MLKYNQIERIPPYLINYKVAEFLLEDIPEGDITTEATINKTDVTTATLQTQEDIVFVGEFFLHYFFDNSFQVEVLKKDGDFARSGDILATIKGYSYLILIRERVLLNIMQRLSGIATLTRKFVDIAKDFGVTILDTRKTTPGLRMFEKYAVTMGGGMNHRLDLSSGILIKDNHIKAAGGIKNALDKCREMFPEKIAEVEVENIQEIEIALKAGAKAFLLDNMTPDEIRVAVDRIRSVPDGNDIFIEASGGMKLDNIKDYLGSGINAISVGALTHSFKSADIHLEFD